jgi:hypothetical protein
LVVELPEGDNDGPQEFPSSVFENNDYAGTSLWVLGSGGCGDFLMTPHPRRISPNEKMKRGRYRSRR